MTKKKDLDTEENFKKFFYTLLDHHNSTLYTAIQDISAYIEILNKSSNERQLKTQFPNVIITINNKFSELANQFQKKRLTFCPAKPDRESFGQDNVSYLASVVLRDLMEYIVLSEGKLYEYYVAIDKILRYKEEITYQIYKGQSYLLFKFFALLKPKLLDQLRLTEEEEHMLNTIWQEFHDIDDSVFEYEIDEKIIPRILKLYLNADSIDDFYLLLETNFIPELEMLGLGHLIPSLKNAFVEETKKYGASFDSSDLCPEKSPIGHLQDIVGNIDDWVKIDKSASATERKKLFDMLGQTLDRPVEIDDPEQETK